MKVTPAFLYPIYGLETTTTCPGCGLGTKLRKHNFVVVPRFTTRDMLHQINAQQFKLIFSSPDPKAQGELIAWDLRWRPCVRPSVCPCTISNINISETSWPIIIKFHQEHHWGGGVTILGFRLDRIRTLVSMATDSSHRVIMGKIL